MKKILLLTILFLCGCIQNRFLYTNENGNDVYQVNCSYGDFGDCLIEANKTCPFGFDIFMSSEIPTGSFSNFHHTEQMNTFGNFSPYNSATYGDSWIDYDRYLIYTCKKIKQK